MRKISPSPDKSGYETAQNVLVFTKQLWDIGSNQWQILAQIDGSRVNPLALQSEIEKALRSKGRLPLLADCAQRLQLNLVEQQARRDLSPEEIITDIDRGRALWQILKEAINRLRPAPTEPELTPEWRLYRIGYEVYVQGRTHDEIAHSLGLPPRTYDRERRAAIQAIAQIIWQLEEASW